MDMLTFMRRDIYASLNESLQVDARSMDIQTKQDLINIMKTGGYRLKGQKNKKKKVDPTEKQLRYAWEYLKNKNLLHFVISHLIYQEENIKYHYGSRKIYRVKKGQTIKKGDKLYKGGQFLPSSFKE